jgi:hypothetical protein
VLAEEEIVEDAEVSLEADASETDEQPPPAAA